MASTKEAMAIVVDVGPSMNQAPPGNSTSLETSLEAVNMILQRKMFSESKDEVTLILFGTPGTANDLADGDAYENVSVARPLGPVDWELLSFVQNEIQSSDISGDFLDAMVVAMDHLVKSTQGRKGFVSKRVILFSDVGGEFGDDQLDDIVGGFKEAGIDFNVVGPDLDDDGDSDDEGPGAANGHVKEKTPQQNAGETLLKHIIQEVNGESYSFNEALRALSFFEARATRPAAWKCNLEIGEDLKIPVNGYIRVKEVKAKTFSQVYARDPDAVIERARTYHLNDEEETEIEKSDTAEGHRYGNTLVPFSEDDKDAMKYKTEKGFTVLGFTSMDKVKRHHVIGDNSMTFIPDKGDEAAAVALSSFIKALYEKNMVAIVRKTYQKNSPVKLGCLFPHIKHKYECLYFTELPFAEDMRQFTFSTLPLSQEGEPAKNTPNEKQLEAMDNLITAMDLTNTGDDDGESEEALKPKLTFNPYLQRLYQCLQHRAVNPDDDLPDLSPLIAGYLKPPQVVETRCEPVLDKMKNLFKLEVVDVKKEVKTGENMFKDDEAGPSAAKKVKKEDDLEGGMADLTKAKVTEVGTVNPVDDFKTMVGQKDEDRFEEACKMMQKCILQLVTDSFDTQFYGKASDCLQALREECIKNGEPKIFNEYLKHLKDILPEKGLKKFWDHIVDEKLSLISKLECEESRVSKDEASQFLAAAEVKTEAAPAEPTQEAEDLFDELE